MITQINLRNHVEIGEINAKRKINAQRGQALLELAIFGMVAIAALGFLIRVGMQMNYDQEIRMAAFRRALAAAAADNGTTQDAIAVTYHYASDRQMPNPTDGLLSLPRSRSEASAFVEWGDRLTFAHQDHEGDDENAGQATQQKIIIRSNGNETVFRQKDLPTPGCDPSDVGCLFITGTDMRLIKKSETRNGSSGGAGQTNTGSWASTPTTTTSTTWVNTKGGGEGTPVSSEIGGGGVWNQ